MTTSGTSTDELIVWLHGEMDKRGWNESDLARELKTRPGVVNKWMSGIQPTTRSCSRIATRFGVSEEYVLMLAGHLSPASQEDMVLEELRSKLGRVDLGRDGRADTLRSLLDGWLEGDRR